jgi:hypothetical protein
MEASNPAGAKSAPSVVDTELDRRYREVLRSVVRGNQSFSPEFEVDCPNGGIYLGFQPFSDSDRQFYGSDVLGIAYVYISDIAHHSEEDPSGDPRTESEFMKSESMFLDTLNHEVCHMLFDECGVSPSFDFLRYNDDSPGGVYYGVPVPRPSCVWKV